MVASHLHPTQVMLQDLAAELGHTVGATAIMMRVHGAWSVDFHAAQILDENAEAQHVIFFQVKGRRVRIGNLFLTLDRDLASLFSKFIFETFPDVQWIEFRDCETPIQDLPRHAFQFSGVTYYQRHLPDHFDDVLKSLSQNTNQNYRRYLKKAQKELNAEILILEKDQLTADMFQSIVDLKNKQLAGLGVPLIGGAYTDALFQIHQHYGLTILVRSQSRLIAAYVLTIAGRRCEFWTTAYDAEFSKYWLGNIAGIEAIRAAVERGCTRFNFLWGLTDHKLMLGGKPERLYHVIQARNQLAYLNAAVQLLLYQPLHQFINRGIGFLRRRIRRFIG